MHQNVCDFFTSHKGLLFVGASIVVRPEMEVVTEGDRDLKTLCLSVNNSASDVTVGFPDSLIPLLIGNQTNWSIAFSESSST